VPKAFEIRQQRGAEVLAATEIRKKADAEARALTAEEKAEIRKRLDAADAYETDAALAERLEGLESSVDARGVRHGDPLPHSDPANMRGQKPYSVVKAIRQSLDAREGRGRLDGVEAETHQDLAKRRNRAPQGVLIPWNLALDSGREVRTGVLNTTTGTGSIPTILAPTLIDLLRTRMAVRAAGCTVMNDMRGLFAIPRQSGAGTGYWVAEAGAPTASNQTIDQVAFSPKTVGAYTDYTRRFLEESNQSAEEFVKNDLMAVVARALDLAALAGTGSSNQPTGILNYASIPTVSLGTNGAAPTYAALVQMETQVAVANADFGSLSYMVNAQGRSTLKQTAKIGSTFPVYLWDTQSPDANGVPQGLVNGYSARVSNQLPSNLTKGTGTALSPIIFGNWSDLVIALWSGLDVLVDPYTGSNSGTVRVVVLQDADINLRHKESFSVIVDMITS
jgi:HK97 family phage major capsid protein